MTVRARSRGFTLIELFVGLAIVALLLLLGMPTFTTFVRNSEIRSTAESIINGLRTASAEAANRNRTVTFSINGAAGAGWTGWDISFVDDDAKRQTIQEYFRKEAGASSAVTVDQGAPTVTFNGLGRMNNPGNDGHIRTITIDSVDGHARPLKIVVDDPKDPLKPLRMCDPDPALATLDPPDPRAC